MTEKSQNFPPLYSKNQILLLINFKFIVVILILTLIKIILEKIRFVLVAISCYLIMREKMINRYWLPID